MHVKFDISFKTLIKGPVLMWIIKMMDRCNRKSMSLSLLSLAQVFLFVFWHTVSIAHGSDELKQYDFSFIYLFLPFDACPCIILSFYAAACGWWSYYAWWLAFYYVAHGYHSARTSRVKRRCCFLCCLFCFILFLFSFDRGRERDAESWTAVVNKFT